MPGTCWCLPWPSEPKLASLWAVGPTQKVGSWALGFQLPITINHYHYHYQSISITINHYHYHYQSISITVTFPPLLTFRLGLRQATTIPENEPTDDFSGPWTAVANSLISFLPNPPAYFVGPSSLKNSDECRPSQTLGASGYVSLVRHIIFFSVFFF